MVAILHRVGSGQHSRSSSAAPDAADNLTASSIDSDRYEEHETQNSLPQDMAMQQQLWQAHEQRKQQQQQQGQAAQAAPATAPVRAKKTSSKEWACPVCTFLNFTAQCDCEMCGFPRNPPEAGPDMVTALARSTRHPTRSKAAAVAALAKAALAAAVATPSSSSSSSSGKNEKLM